MLSQPIKAPLKIARHAVTFAALAACTESVDAPERSPIVDQRLPLAEQFMAIAEAAIENQTVEGLQFALITDGEIARVEAMGLADRESARAMTVHTPINVASISKSVTAWGTVAAARSAGIALSASISDQLGNQDLYRETFGSSDITLQMLLTHTSGLSGASVPVTPATEALPRIEAIFRGRSTVPRPTAENPPGHGFSYSGVGYLLLQQFIEHQSRQRFATFMFDTVLKPAGMLDSTFAFTPQLSGRTAVYYRDDGRRREPYHLPGAAGGLYSTAADMAKFIILYTDTGKTSRNAVIGDPDFATMLSDLANADVPQTLSYGLGHYVYTTPENVRLAFHAGGNPGLRALFIVAPELGTGFFAAANSDRGNDVIADLLRLWGQHHGLHLPSPF